MSGTDSFGDGKVLYAVKDGIATVILNRPEKLNALDKAMWLGLGEAMQYADQDHDLGCVILRGAGEKAMGPGADIGEFETARANAQQAAEYGQIMHHTMAAIRDCQHPVIAQIHGLCVGGALELAIMCDMRICGDSARFGVPINRLGLTMAYPEIEALINLVGRSTALEILFEARVFGAAEAKDKGLINKVVADDQVAAETAATAARIAAGAPLVNRWHKAFANRVMTGLHTPQPVDASDVVESYAAFDTEDFNTGFRAFLAKKTPVFKGR